MAELDERFLDVNRYGVLRVPLALWLGIAFVGRYWLLLVIVMSSVRRSPETVQLLGHGVSWLMLLLELPVLLLAYAGLSRVPTGGVVPRLIWSKGRLILGSTAILNLAWLAWFLWSSDTWQRWPHLFLASCGLLDFAITYGIYQSAYLRQIFLEFPKPVAQGPSP